MRTTLESMVETKTDSADAVTVALVDHIRRNGDRYFKAADGLEPVVRLVSYRSRPQSALYFFEAAAAAGDRQILVKLTRPGTVGRTTRSASGGRPRPRLTPPADPEDKHVHEHRALEVIYDHFTGLNDARFGAVKVFGTLGMERGLAMEAVGMPSLRRIAVQRSVGTRASDRGELLRTFEHAGCWLREYHGISKTTRFNSAHATRQGFVDFCAQLTSYLGHGRTRRFLADVQTRIALEAQKVMGPELPMGLAHGDFAMRNVLVAPDARVIVVDTLARDRLPVHRDIAYFLTDLTCNVLPALGRGALDFGFRLSDYRAAFLAGYFGSGGVSPAVIRLFEVQVLLERWSSAVARTQGGVRGIKAGMSATYYEVLIRRYLAGGSTASAR